MLSALWGHFVLLLKGRHDLRGLPQSFNLSFIFLLIPALAMDELMHVLILDESPWLVLVTLTLALLLGKFVSFGISSAILLLVIFSSAIWAVLVLASRPFDVTLPYSVFLTISSIIIIRLVIFWLRRGLLL